MSIDKSTLDKKCVLGIKYSLSVAQKIIRDYPEVAQEYFSGKMILDIVRDLHLCEDYGVGVEIAKSAVSYALRGYSGDLMEPFQGLVLDLNLLDDESKKHRVRGSIQSGIQSLEQGKGIHGRSLEQRAIDSRKAVIAQGKKPWVQEEIIGKLRIPSELEIAIELSLLPEYQISGTTDNTKISKKLNQLYHGGDQIRTPSAVAKKLGNHRKENNIQIRGSKTYWSEEETNYCLQILNEDNVQFSKGLYLQICYYLNHQFHEGEPVRTYGAVKTKMSNLKKK